MSVTIPTPYLVFAGNDTNKAYAKTGLGLAYWCPDLCVGQLRQTPGAADMGLTDMTVEEAVKAGAKSLVVGVAPIGGDFEADWLAVFRDAMTAGLDIVAGLHAKLADNADLVALAKDTGRTLHDLRVPPASLPIGNGNKRGGKRLLTVGTDCSVGKKYTALSIWKALKEKGANADFRASGQTGILIAGGGIPIDAVVSDFVSGAAEFLSPDNTDDHWDIVEGQGSLFHPSYAGVTLGLLHGSQPDAFVLCHDAARPEIQGMVGFPIPDFQEAIDRYRLEGALTNPAIRCVGVSINTSSLDDAKSAAYLDETSARLGLPCVDPIRTGVASIIDHMATVYSV